MVVADCEFFNASIDDSTHRSIWMITACGEKTQYFFAEWLFFQLIVDCVANFLFASRRIQYAYEWKTLNVVK